MLDLFLVLSRNYCLKEVNLLPTWTLIIPYLLPEFNPEKRGSLEVIATMADDGKKIALEYLEHDISATILWNNTQRAQQWPRQLQGDPNQNLGLQLAIAQKQCISDPKL